MAKDLFSNPHLQSGYTGEERDERVAETGPAIQKKALSAAENRGKRAPQQGSGVVVGSGAGAGGGGGSEDFDSDPQAGGGSPVMNGPTTGQNKPASDDR